MICITQSQKMIKRKDNKFKFEFISQRKFSLYLSFLVYGMLAHLILFSNLLSLVDCYVVIPSSSPFFSPSPVRESSSFSSYSTSRSFATDKYPFFRRSDAFALYSSKGNNTNQMSDNRNEKQQKKKKVELSQ